MQLAIHWRVLHHYYYYYREQIDEPQVGQQRPLLGFAGITLTHPGGGPAHLTRLQSTEKCRIRLSLYLIKSTITYHIVQVLYALWYSDNRSYLLHFIAFHDNMGCKEFG